MQRITIRLFSGVIVGYYDVDESGNKTVRAFTGEILGYYEKKRDATTDFHRRIIAYGDVTGLFFQDKISIRF